MICSVNLKKYMAADILFIMLIYSRRNITSVKKIDCAL